MTLKMILSGCAPGSWLPGGLTLALLACTSSSRVSAPSNSPEEASAQDSTLVAPQTMPIPRPLPDAGLSDAALPEPRVLHFSAQAMGTSVDITVWASDEKTAGQATGKVFAEFDRVDALMSSWLSDSAVAEINRAAGKHEVVVSEELFELVSKALDASKESLGAFDITVGAFRGLWKFDQDVDGSIPSKSDVAKRTRLVSFKKVRLSRKKHSIKLTRTGMRITLGGIAKGYAVDRGVAIMRKAGFNDFILQAGGDLYASGRKGDRNWRVGIRDPRGSRQASFAMAEITNHTFSTSGDYERFVVKNGIRYHHLLDPTTGRPATRSRSVTVRANDALTADIWSTALFILGPERGMKIVERRDDLGAVFVDENNSMHISRDLRDKVQILTKPSPGI